MLDENLIATLETSLRQTRNHQHQLMVRLREVEAESDRIREEIQALENTASKMEQAIDGLIVSLRSGSEISSGVTPKNIRFDDSYYHPPDANYDQRAISTGADNHRSAGGTIAYINQQRAGVPSRAEKIEPISHRFADRTITQACTLLLREAGRPLHVNELYNLLVAGGMEFKGNNPTISVAVSLNRNRRFRKVEPGTFDLAIREASKLAS